jgi:3-deoxy-manno-octulosonate cytidylyltransferase (CMP-KDO synthetase)
MTAPVLAVIPARLGSSRLPRKPLYPLVGRPLIEWVWRRVRDAGVFAEVVIATDSEEVADAARGFGAAALLTDERHPSGTDRVAEIAARPEYRGYEVIVNVQGDEPFVRADHLSEAARLVAEAGWGIGTLAAPIGSIEEWRDPAAVKLVRDERGGALYFSRAPIPWQRDGELSAADFASGRFLRHLGIYAYSRDALERWVALPEGELERIERLEQLRPLAAGLEIGVAVVEAGSADEGGVDTPADAERAERRLLEELSTAASALDPTRGAWRMESEPFSDS